MGFAINGKFASQRITGVQRVAYELTRAMQSHTKSPTELPVLIPSNATDLGLAARPTQIGRRLKGNLWEQIALPLESRRDTLISLCNTGPLFKRRHMLMIHDMAVYDVPHGFSKEFVMWYRLRFSLLRRQASTILTVSGFSRNRICHHLGVDESRVMVVRPGADHMDRVTPEPSILERLSLVKDRYCVLVGSLDPRKNLRRVLEATRLLKDLDGFKFVIAGGANARVFASSDSAPTLDSDSVIWAGFVTDGELKALYGSAACLVFASLYEGYGLPPLEAMYCGCPVIVSSEASLPEVCGDAAMYCDASSVEDIAAKIRIMATQEDVRAMHRRAGLEHARKFKWDGAATRLLEILQTTH
ncbi:glycosyltransferase family 1 protein [Caballeronia sp. M1242]|uniref:glycosyltransferase family 4 protein n=1 Tax=Caballeronia sp. M1242 TaxID=2814653 RepID=UPI0019D027A5|nr:glycosyltransferase family 1 protein [Caballeronia sp. M1242]QSN64045.1 glycosyltransferase family 4 protein [Caballeronia sp. M1242]